MLYIKSNYKLKNLNFINYKFCQYFNLKTQTQFLQEIMNIGFKYSTIFIPVINLETFKNFIYLKPLYKIYSLKKYIYQYKYIEFNNTNNLYYSKILSSFIFNKFFILISIYKYINPISNFLYLITKLKFRGSIEQFYQLTSFRGYISNLRGILYQLPIMQNFSYGLNIYEYILSTYGSRKGIIDTVLKVSDSGYFTRKLMEISQNISIKEFNCGTNKKIFFKYYLNSKGNLNNIISKNIILKYYINLFYSFRTKHYYLSNIINNIFFKQIQINNHILICLLYNSCCLNCYGLFNIKYFILSLPIGILIAHSITEPGTQLTLKTFHLGGASNINININKNFKSLNIKFYLYKYIYINEYFILKNNIIFLNKIYYKCYIYNKYNGKYIYKNLKQNKNILNINTSILYFGNRLKKNIYISIKNEYNKYNIFIIPKYYILKYKQNVLSYCNEKILFKIPLNLIKFNVQNYILNIAIGEIFIHNGNFLIYKNSNFKWKLKTLKNTLIGIKNYNIFNNIYFYKLDKSYNNIYFLIKKYILLYKNIFFKSNIYILNIFDLKLQFIDKKNLINLLFFGIIKDEKI